MLRIGFWKWPLVVLLTALGVYGAYRRTGGLVHYYETEALLKTVDAPRLARDLETFRSADVRREIASALGWIKPNPTPVQLAAVLDKLNHVLTWDRAGMDRIRVRGTGKDPAGIAWVVNTAAKTTIVLSEKAASPSVWHLMLQARAPQKPVRTEGAKPLGIGGMAGLLLSLLIFSGKRSAKTTAPAPVAALPELTLHLKTVAEKPVELPEVVPVPDPVPDPIPSPSPILDPQPIALEVIQPTPAPAASAAPVPVTVDTLYTEWLACAAPVYRAPDAAAPAPDWASQVDRLMEKTTDWLGDSFDALLRHLAQRTRDGDAVHHVVNTVLLGFVRAQHEGLPWEETRLLAWSALLHDVGLKVLPLAALLRAPAQRSQESAAYMKNIGLEDVLQNQVVLILSRLGARRGMRPALTPDEEKAARLALLLTRLDRQEKILRRRALILAKRHSLEKAI